MERIIVLLCLCAALLSWSKTAAAQVGGARDHLGVGMALDFGGEVEFGRNAPSRAWDDLDATVGLRGHWDHAVHRYVSIGALLRMSWWEPDYTLSMGRSFLLDPCFRVTGHYDWRDFRFYGGLAPGLTLSVIDDDGLGVNNPAAGFTMSVTVAGMEWWFSRKAGLFVELGWVGHWFEHDGEGGTRDLEVHLSQGLFEFGFVFGV
ncbi:MAG TPA: hypothetical protein VI299_28440 [Polyangiales bacterium]